MISATSSAILGPCICISDNSASEIRSRHPVLKLGQSRGKAPLIQRSKSEIVEPRRERHQVDVGETGIGAKDPRPGLGQRILQQLECSLVSRNPMFDVWRTHAEFVSRHEAVSAVWVANVAKAPFADFFRHVAHAFSEHGRKAKLVTPSNNPSSTILLHRRIRVRCQGSEGISRGSGKVSSRYSQIRVDSMIGFPS
jgi:hypothetical protein